MDAERLTDEAAARLALAAAHRIIDAFGWTSLVSNHLTLRVPGDPDYFLIKPHELLFEEVTASSLIRLHIDQVSDESSNVNAAGYAIHSALLRARPDLNALAHIHSDAGMSVSALKGGLLFMTQASMRFFDRLSYHQYDGISDLSEGEQLCKDLGQNRAMILRNHGLLTTGRSIGEAVVDMYYLVTACRTQLDAQASGDPIIIPDAATCAQAAGQWDAYDREGGKAEWPALIRMIERRDASYRD
ncbi:class II aldolase/adducin family protein [Acuticoccus mangrovi]|uniref:Class II aldolase/adducin family protein n=1 Tax=Acuticoccus mangrovi TaxID=2796142 RepID=A0A934IQY7_9HYPH|nr:class II aldolase/adducin family protein [Acuticoccus mangrovi]MBJ3777096.1 class II aldolase/adducin family protein [Acuticoccus mangrovi]